MAFVLSNAGPQDNLQRRTIADATVIEYGEPLITVTAAAPITKMTSAAENTEFIGFAAEPKAASDGELELSVLTSQEGFEVEVEIDTPAAHTIGQLFAFNNSTTVTQTATDAILSLSRVSVATDQTIFCYILKGDTAANQFAKGGTLDGDAS